MLSLEFFYDYNEKYTIESWDVVLDALKDTYLCYVIS